MYGYDINASIYEYMIVDKWTYMCAEEERREVERGNDIVLQIARWRIYGSGKL